MPHLFIAGIRVPFHASRFTRPANQTPRQSSAADRQGQQPHVSALPVNLFPPFHGEHNGQ